MDSTLTCEDVSTWSIRFESVFMGPKSSSVVHKEPMPLHFMFIFAETPYIYSSFTSLSFMCKRHIPLHVKNTSVKEKEI